MITEDCVSFETAELLKENEFDEYTNCYYIEGCVGKNPYYSPMRQNHNKRITNNEFDIDIDITSGKISAPTLQMAMKWLREKHNIDISVTPDRKAGYSVLIFKDKRLPFDTLDSYSTYEAACETAIKYCLENLI